MISKNQKIRVLESFKSLDYVFFGKPVSQMTTCCPVIIEDYINTKGALLSVMIEMYKLVKTKPIIEGHINSSKLTKLAKGSAVIAREHAKRLVSTKGGKKDIKNSLHELMNQSQDFEVSQLVEEQVKLKSLSLAVDNLLIARTLAESSNVGINKLNGWEGRILEDAYKVMRDSLVEQAMGIIVNNELSSK
jgi:hypothetical protein